MAALFDPVCGVKVTGAALWAEGHDDVVFCSENCRKAFPEDPARYKLLVVPRGLRL